MDGDHERGLATAAGEFLLTPEEFRVALEHERAHSDRSGEPFALLVFTLGGEPGRARDEAAVAALSRRVRATDALGWFGARELGALLRFASVEDALSVAHDVRTLAGAADGELRCTVHGHPPFTRGTARAPRTLQELTHHVSGQPDQG